MKRLLNYLTVVCVLLFGHVAMAANGAAQQAGTITVQVSDSNGPLPGAGVLIKGTTTGSVTDLDGIATLSAKEGDVIEVSFIGYVTQEVTVGKASKITVTLYEDSTELDETIVVGYGVQKKESLTGAISQIRSEDITNTKGPDALVSLQGKVPGLLIRDQGGKPGAFATDLSLRGYGTPMIVVDGVVRNTTRTRKTTGWTNSASSIESYNDMSVLQEINPEDIESVSVLKDASATIYGLGAQNGVIVITTKKGKVQKPSVSYSATLRLQQPVTNRRIEDWGSFMKWDNAMSDVAKLDHRWKDADITAWERGDLELTDWYSVASRKFAATQQHNFSVRGGTESISYYFGLGYSEDASILKGNYGYDRYNMSGNVDIKLTPALSMRYTTSFRISNTLMPGNPDVDWNLFYYIYASEPTVGVMTKDNPSHYSEVNEHMNVAALLNPDASGYAKTIGRSWNNTVDFTYNAPFLKGLTVTATGAYDYSTNKSRTLILSYKTYDYETDTYAGELRTQDEYSELWTDNVRLYARAQANYNKKIGSHNFTAMLGAEMTNTKNASIQALRKYGATADESFYTHDIINQGLSSTSTNAGTRSENASAGYIGRFTYDYQGKYLVELMGRYDGTYVYAPGHRWGFFPSYSLGWRASEEKFIKDNLPFLNNLKFRWSDGKTGSIQGGAYAYLSGYQSSGSWIFANGATTPGFNSTTVENTILTWADVRMMDFGIDWEMWRGKFGGQFDIFKRKTIGTAATRTVSLPDFYGVSLPQENLNSNENVGLELALNTNGQIGQINYRAALSATYTRSRQTYIESENTKLYKSSMNYWQSCTLNRWSNARSASLYHWAGGQFTSLDAASNSLVMYETGKDSNGNRDIVPGMYKIDDRDGDGYITSADNYFTWGDGNPPLQFGLNMSASYKKLDVSLVFSGAALKRKSLGLSSYAGFGYLYQLPKMYTEDCWSVKNYGADPWDPNTEWNSGYWPALVRVKQSGSSHNATYTSNQPYNFVNATYLRLKTLEVGYRVSPDFIRKAGIKSVRLAFNAGNLFTLCNKNLKFVDPESTDNGRAGGSFQINRTYNFTLNLNF